MKKLLNPLITQHIQLQNRVVMAPMNRRRANNGIPNESMAVHYEQRASAGLLITDNLAIAPNGGAYMNTPGIYNDEQKQAWKKIVDGVHAKGGKIFAQLVHSGRVGHPAIQNGEPLIAPSAINVNETIRTPQAYQPMAMPLEITADAIPFWVNAFRAAALNAIDVGFDGVEIHAAHGFLIDQFINPHSNTRTDDYGLSIANRTRFLFEVLVAVIDAIGKEKTGIRLSPFRDIYDLHSYPAEEQTHQYIMDKLQLLDIFYVHFSIAVTGGKPSIPLAYLRDARNRFKNTIIVAGGFDIDSAEEILQSELADLVAFGKLYISNPDLVERIEQHVPLAAWNEETFYYGGDKGYIDYPKYNLYQ
jgi:N-ethylmaleimide reductase